MYEELSLEVSSVLGPLETGTVGLRDNHSQGIGWSYRVPMTIR